MVLSLVGAAVGEERGVGGISPLGRWDFFHRMLSKMTFKRIPELVV